MVDSPAYRLNHEEVIKALEEGIAFAENLNPIEAVPDERGARAGDGLQARRAGAAGRRAGRRRVDAAGADGAGRRGHDAEHHLREGSAGHVPARREEEVLPAARGVARTATAASISTPDAERLLHVVRRRTAGSSATTATTIRATPATSSRRWRRRRTGIRTSSSCSRDELAALDPAQQARARRARGARWSRGSTTSCIARVEDVVRLTPTIVEVIVKAPAAARHFHPGQFYRLQNYESVAPARRTATPLLMEGIALTGAWVDKERGLLSLIALELGVSSRLCAYLQQGRAGGRDGADRHADRDSRAARTCCCSAAASATRCCSRSPRRCATHGNRVIYFAGYKKGEDLFKREEIEAATDQVIWSTDIGAAIAPGRPQDAHFRGNIVQAMLAYSAASSATPLVPLRHGRSHHRDRIGPHDGGGEGGAPRRAGAAS